MFLDAERGPVAPAVAGDAPRAALGAQQLTAGGVVAALELERRTQVRDPEQGPKSVGGLAVDGHARAEVGPDAVLPPEHLGEPFGAELATDAGEGRRIASGVTEVVVALEEGLACGIGAALAVALMAGDAIQRLEREVGGQLG